MKHALMLGLALAVVAGCSRDDTADMESSEAEPAPGSRAWKIRNARSAAPYEVAAGATVLDWPAHDSLPFDTLERGTTGWTCLPDMAATPTNDPVCADEEFGGWADAWLARRPPAVRAMGVAYMLQGGQVASDTDPFKMSPDSGQPWLVDPPHLMIVMPNPRQSFATLPTARTATGPWVMYAGTPYAHLMVPLGSAVR